MCREADGQQVCVYLVRGCHGNGDGLVKGEERREGVRRKGRGGRKKRRREDDREEG